MANQKHKGRSIMSDFNLIKQIDETVETKLMFEHNCIAITEGIDIAVLQETAEEILGKATAALKGGKNPFFKKGAGGEVQELPFLHVVRGLMALAKKDVRDDLSINDKALAVVAAQAGDTPKITQRLKNIGAGAKSLLNPENLQSPDGLKELTRKLDKLRDDYRKIAAANAAKETGTEKSADDSAMAMAQ